MFKFYRQNEAASADTCLVHQSYWLGYTLLEIWVWNPIRRIGSWYLCQKLWPLCLWIAESSHTSHQLCQSSLAHFAKLDVKIYWEGKNLTKEIGSPLTFKNSVCIFSSKHSNLWISFVFVCRKKRGICSQYWCMFYWQSFQKLFQNVCIKTLLLHGPHLRWLFYWSLPFRNPLTSPKTNRNTLNSKRFQLWVSGKSEARATDDQRSTNIPNTW